jgi:hypothetical protein
MSHSTDFAWIQRSDGVYERPIDLIEQLELVFANTAARFGKKDIQLHAVISYATQSKDLVVKFKQAWLSLRFVHPSIASYVENSKKVYKDDWDEWLSDTFVVSDQTPEQILADSPPLSRPQLFILQDSAILFRTPHECCDGTGLLLLTDAFFTILSSPIPLSRDDPQIPSRLSRPFFAAAPVPPPGPNGEAEALSTIKTLSQPSVGLPSRNLDQPPTRCAFSRITLAKEASDSVIKGAKAAGFTVTAAVHAALLMAVQELGSKGACKALPPINIRQRGKNSVRDFTIPCISAIACSVPAGDYKSTAEVLKKHYLACKNFDLANYSVGCELFIKALSAPPPPGTPADTTPEMSSLGILENYVNRQYGEFEITDFWAAFANYYTQPRLFLSTFRGQISLNASYNETFQSKEDIDELLRSAKKVLLKELVIGS